MPHMATVGITLRDPIVFVLPEYLIEKQNPKLDDLTALITSIPIFQLIRRHPWCAVFILWTLGSAVLVTWIFQRPLAEPIIIRGDETGQSGGWPLFDHSFHPFYPWLLLAPLVIALCLRFPIGLRQSRTALPLILFGGGAFVFLSHSFTKHYASKLPPLTYVSVQTAVTATPENQPSDSERGRTIEFTYTYDQNT